MAFRQMCFSLACRSSQYIERLYDFGGVVVDLHEMNYRSTNVLLREVESVLVEMTSDDVPSSSETKMSVSSPSEVKEKLISVRNDLLGAKESISKDDQVKLGVELSEPCDYVSAIIGDSQYKANVARIYAATEQRRIDQCKKEQENLVEHREFVFTTLENAERYFKTIQLAGYAAFFAIWAFTKQWLDAHLAVWAALLMTLSATIFVIWEVARASFLTVALKTHGQLAASKLERFIEVRGQKFGGPSRAIKIIAAWRSYVWAVCLFFSGLAVVILLKGFVCYLI